MKSAKSILKKYIREEEYEIGFSLLEKIMDEYADQFKPKQLKALSFENWQLRQILMEVCGLLGVNEMDICSRSRKRDFTDARAVFCRRARTQLPGVPWKEIGAIIHKDHATSLHAFKRAFSVKEIVTKYNKCYADQTKIAYAIMASAGGTGIRSIATTKTGRVVSYGKVEKREPSLQGSASAMCGM
jgi:chromosomal replication initiation ATPase DnaA